MLPLHHAGGLDENLFHGNRIHLFSPVCICEYNPRYLNGLVNADVCDTAYEIFRRRTGVGVDRTIKPGEGKKRWILSIRTTTEGRQRLRDAADEQGRSLSEEIENRLQVSFHRDDAYGGSANAAFVNLLGALIRDTEAETGKSWRTDRLTWEKVRDRIAREVDERAPRRTPGKRRVAVEP